MTHQQHGAEPATMGHIRGHGCRNLLPDKFAVSTLASQLPADD